MVVFCTNNHKSMKKWAKESIDYTIFRFCVRRKNKLILETCFMFF